MEHTEEFIAMNATRSAFKTEGQEEILEITDSSLQTLKKCPDLFRAFFIS
jgi:hypothetical protein